MRMFVTPYNDSQSPPTRTSCAGCSTDILQHRVLPAGPRQADAADVAAAEDEKVSNVRNTRPYALPTRRNDWALTARNRKPSCRSHVYFPPAIPSCRGHLYADFRRIRTPVANRPRVRSFRMDAGKKAAESMQNRVGIDCRIA
jgi:hypothetical protein